ncbi:integral membrane [Fusarium albosuccineum]|uniref:Integral membrane n=1 Tax=Fusarium albosuccineum TaxID=1237068 RepID=A0A8H4LQW8_9HYPO|nr:integral membrane [Fusarium albosuccineum]
MWAIADVPIVPRNHALVICGFLFTSLSTFCVCLRIFARTFLVYTIGLDDFIVVASMLGSIAFLTGTVSQIKYGLGDAVRLEVLQQFLQSLLATVIAYSFTQITVKISIVVQYRRILISKGAQRLFNWLLTWLSVYGLFCVLSSIITCWPIAKYWNDSIPGGCIDRSILHYVLASVNIINDILVLIAPWPFLNKLLLGRKAKMALIGVFGCGIFVCIVTMVRLHSLYVNNSAPIDQQPVKGVDIALWSGLEINVAIMCASVSTLRLLFTWMFHSLASTFANSYVSRKSDRRKSNLQLLSNPNGNVVDPTNHRRSKMIHVRRSIEMETLNQEDDDSDRNLIICQGSSTEARPAQKVDNQEM